jgi:hypothetical protein
MQVYLPIAEMSVDALLLLGIGFGVGWLSGLFGVGGGFLLTPLLILIGIPSPVAVASGANQTLGASVSGLIAQWRRDNVDTRMGLVLLAGGFVGSALGVQLFAALRRAGQVDVAVSFFYVVVLGTVGMLMVRESLRAILRRRRTGAAGPARAGEHTWLHGLPMKMRFRKSRLYISIVPPLLVGFGIGVLSAVMGVGGGFFMVPAMIYVLRMPTNVVIGTSLFSIVIITALVTVQHAAQTQTVDLILAVLLIGGGVVGAQLGARVGARLKAEELRIIMGVVVFATGIRILWDLLARPGEMYALGY